LEEDQKGQDDERRSDMRHDEVEQSRITYLGLLVLRHHEEIGQQRHEFPHDQEEEPVVGNDHECHREEKPIEKRPKRCDRGAPIKFGHVADCIDRCGQANQRDGQHE
jgi:hypothetical protein